MSGPCVSRTCIPGKQEREPSECSVSADRAIRCSPCGEATWSGGDKPGSSPRLPPSKPKSAMGGKRTFQVVSIYRNDPKPTSPIIQQSRGGSGGHVVLPSASRRPDKNSSRCCGLRY